MSIPDVSQFPGNLASRRQWLCWRFVQKPGQKKPSKMPYYATTGALRGWPMGKPRDGRATEQQPQVEQGHPLDREHLTGFEEAAAFAAARGFDGVGFAFLPGDGLIGIDLDGVIGGDDARTALGLQITADCDTYGEMSPSGTGLHLIGLGDVQTFKSNDIGIEVFCGRQFFTMTGHHHPDTPFEVRKIPEETIGYLRGMVERAKLAAKEARPVAHASPAAQTHAPAPSGRDEAARYCLAALDSAVQRLRSTREGGRNDMLNGEAFGLGQLLRTGGVSEATVRAALADAALASGLDASEVTSTIRSGIEAGKDRPRSIPERQQRAAAPAPAPAPAEDAAIDPDTGEIVGAMKATSRAAAGAQATEAQMPGAMLMSVDQMLEDCVWIAQGEQVTRLSMPRSIWSWSEFRSLTAAAKTIIEPEDGDRKKPKPTPNSVIWYNSPSRITVDSRTFRPGAGTITTRPGMDQSSGLLDVNSWRPIERMGGQADISLFHDHMAYLFPDAGDRGAFLDWLAHLEQRPGELPHYGWLHIAEKTGTGRNWLASLLSRIWGAYVAPSVDLPALLESQFNGQIAGKVLAVVDEIREGGGESVYKHANRLKSIINQEMREINPKYGRQYTEYNALRWLVFSNHLEALPMDETDRRWRVVTHYADPRPESVYSAMYAALRDDSFVDSVAVWLGKRDISQFNPGARPPMTQAKRTAIHATMSAAQQYAREIVARWPSDVITSADAAEILADHADGDPRKPAMNPHFRRSMEEAGAVAVGKVVKVGGHPHRCWVIRNHDQWDSGRPAMIAREALRARDGRGTSSTARFVLMDSPVL